MLHDNSAVLLPKFQHKAIVYFFYLINRRNLFYDNVLYTLFILLQNLSESMFSTQ